MTIWAIVPVKPLRLGKSRLAGVLTDDERGVLNRKFLEQTLQTLRGMPEIAQILVVSRDPAALAIAREFGARTVLEDGNPNLNLALTRATLLARNYATRGVLVLPADLPLLTSEDVRGLLDRARRPPCVVIAPDRHQNGTNALFMNPGGIIPYSFGPGSFHRHREAAQQAGIGLHIVQNAHFGFDLDTPDDLRILKSLEESILERR